MSTLALAKHRTLRRRHEAGAAMFVVSMMVTVLAAVGAFALAASATEVKTAGNERQNAQTHYLSQFGMLAFARETQQGKVASIVALAKSNPDTCISLPIPAASSVNGNGKESDLSKSCRRIQPAEFQVMGAWNGAATVAFSGSTPYATGAATVGSLGPVLTNPGFFVEATDISTRAATGFSSGTCNFAVITATSYGVTQPMNGTAAVYGAEGMELQRARVVAGPLCNGPQ
jgi:hypothetical protein